MTQGIFIHNSVDGFGLAHISEAGDHFPTQRRPRCRDSATSPSSSLCPLPCSSPSVTQPSATPSRPRPSTSSPASRPAHGFRPKGPHSAGWFTHSSHPKPPALGPLLPPLPHRPSKLHSALWKHLFCSASSCLYVFRPSPRDSRRKALLPSRAELLLPREGGSVMGF